MSQPVRIVFLGGLGEIGRNCFCLEVDDRIVVVDCGLMFPDADMPGVDLVLPDFTYLRENADRVEAILLTHAHEDHAGGIAFLLRDIAVPVYGSALSLALARNRIEEAGKLDLTPVDGRRTDLALMGEIARRDGGVRLLMADSTNAERPGFTPSESTVGAAMRSLFREYDNKRFIVASFASHLHRVQQVAQ